MGGVFSVVFFVKVARSLSGVGGVGGSPRRC